MLTHADFLALVDKYHNDTAILSYHDTKHEAFQELQSAIDTFRQFLTYKCQGKTNVVEIDERHTTQLNCLTGKKFDQKVELKDRTVQLSDSIIIDRDLNSAINILKRWESYHLAFLIAPLDLSNVLEEKNLFQRTLRL